MSKLKELNEKRVELATEIRKFAAEFNDNDKQWKDGEQEKNWDRLNADYDANLKELESAEAASRIESRLSALESDESRSINPLNIGREDSNAYNNVFRNANQDDAPTEKDHNLALAGWMSRQLGRSLNSAQELAIKKTRFPIHASALNFATPDTSALRNLQQSFNSIHPLQRGGFEFNAPLTTGTAATGGDLIPAETLLSRLEISMLAFGPMRTVAEIITTSSGETLQWPTASDHANSAAIVAESTAPSEVLPSFGQVTWESYKYTSGMILVPNELLEDSVIDLPSVLGSMIGERMGRGTNAHYTTGTGSSQPNGIVTAAGTGVTAASSTVIAPGEVFDLQHSVDPAYREGASFMCHDTIALHLRKKVDSENRPLWQSGYQAGMPDTLAGSPLVINQAMSSALTTGQKVLLFGQLSKYKIRRVNGMRFYRLQERYRDTDQDGFVAFIREDGNLLDAGTDPVKLLVLA